MRHLIASIAVLFWASNLFAIEAADCQKMLVPVDTPFPKYPSPTQSSEYLKGTSYMHVFVTGEVSVEYTVLPAGTIEKVKVIESKYEPIGRGNFPDGYFDGYLESNVISTVKEWLYQPINTPCIALATFKYELEDNP